MFCVFCGKKLDTDSTFCIHRGKQVVETDNIIESTHNTEAMKPSIFCIHCGKSLDGTTKFCRHCGSLVVKDSLLSNDKSVSGVQITDSNTVQKSTDVGKVQKQSASAKGQVAAYNRGLEGRKDDKKSQNTTDLNGAFVSFKHGKQATEVNGSTSGQESYTPEENQGRISLDFIGGIQKPNFDGPTSYEREDIGGQARGTSGAAETNSKEENSDDTTKIIGWILGILIVIIIIIVASQSTSSSSKNSTASTSTKVETTSTTKDYELRRKEEELAREKEKHEQEVKALEKEKDEFKKERERLQKEMAEARDGSSSSYSSSNSSSYMYGSSSRDYAVRNARRALIDYHKAISDGYISSAYDMLTTHRQEVMGGLSSMRQGYSTTVSSVLTYARPTSISDDSVTFDYKLDAIDNINGRRVYQTFVGDVTMVKIGGRWYMDDMSGRVI